MGELNERRAFARFAEHARLNAVRFAAREPLQGLAHALETETYCT